MDKLIVAIGGIGLIEFVWWFFFGGKKQKGGMHEHH